MSVEIIKVDDFAVELVADRYECSQLASFASVAVDDFRQTATYSKLLRNKLFPEPDKRFEGRFNRGMGVLLSRVMYEAMGVFLDVSRQAEAEISPLRLRGAEVAVVASGLHYGASLAGAEFRATERWMTSGGFAAHARTTPAITYLPVNSPLEERMFGINCNRQRS